VKLNEDGTVGVICAATEIGTGAIATGLRQIVAEELGVPFADVIVLPPDTDAAQYDAGAQGSRTTFAIGNAARDAAIQVKQRVLDVASGLLEAAVEDLELVDGHVAVVGAGDHKVPLAAVALTALWTAGPISAAGKHIAPPVPFDAGCMAGALFTAFAAATTHVHLAEVEIDPTTGKVQITRYVVAQDVGRAINPQMLEGQIHGGVMQGIGYALFEEQRLVDGRVLEDSLETYRLPTALDAVPIEIDIFENPCPYGPFGAKGAAEPPVVPVAAAIACAVADALGTPLTELPLSPFRVLEHLLETTRLA
jgi:CO/xanthine dehydrogenase Mo-binding subunit